MNAATLVSGIRKSTQKMEGKKVEVPEVDYPSFHKTFAKLPKNAVPTAEKALYDLHFAKLDTLKQNHTQ